MLHQNSQKHFCCPNGIAIVVVIVTGRCCIVDVAAAFFDCAKEADKGVPSSPSACHRCCPFIVSPSSSSSSYSLSIPQMPLHWHCCHCRHPPMEHTSSCHAIPEGYEQVLRPPPHPVIVVVVLVLPSSSFSSSSNHHCTLPIGLLTRGIDLRHCRPCPLPQPHCCCRRCPCCSQ